MKSFDMYLSVAQVAAFASLVTTDNEAFIPEIWAQESLMQLEENMVAANLVHRDFENELAEFGDVVNTRKPRDFKIRRRTDSSGATARQSAISDNVRVPLDQWIESKFIIKDAEMSKSFKDLQRIYLAPAARNLARAVDRALLGRVHAFIANRAGRLNGLDKTTASDFVLDAREQMNINLVPEDMRHLILSPRSETPMQKTSLFVSAEQRGDGGEALENARLGRIHGFNTWLGQNVPSVNVATDVATGTITNALAAGGSGSQACTITGYEVNLGEYAVVEGNDQPTHITAATASTNTTAVTMNEANKYATAALAPITVYKAYTAKGAYAAGHSEAVVVDGWTIAPKVGQLLAHGTGASRQVYTIIEAEDDGTDATIYLDRPLETAMADDDLVFPGPTGSYNLAFHRNALALVTRPLAIPTAGVQSGVASFNGLSMRVSFQHDIDESGTVVKMDMLAGVAVLDEALAVMLLG